MATTEDVLVNARLQEIRAGLHKMNEEIATLQGNWEEATIKLQRFDSEMGNVRAQLQSTTEELDNKLSNDEALMRK